MQFPSCIYGIHTQYILEHDHSNYIYIMQQSSGTNHVSMKNVDLMEVQLFYKWDTVIHSVKPLEILHIVYKSSAFKLRPSGFSPKGSLSQKLSISVSRCRQLALPDVSMFKEQTRLEI